LESAPQNTSLQVTTPLTAATPAATLR
jgi:hypothetical protein